MGWTAARILPPFCFLGRHSGFVSRNIQIGTLCNRARRMIEDHMQNGDGDTGAVPGASRGDVWAEA
jgi:hypothetical protein